MEAHTQVMDVTAAMTLDLQQQLRSGVSTTGRPS
jgi:hypothetical protein